MPIKKTLVDLLSDITVRQAVFEGNSDGDYLSSFSAGALCRESAYSKENSGAIQLLLYQDAFEVPNPLGLAKKKHKILGMYYTVANLPSHFITKVHNIQLVMVCYESTLIKLGLSVVMKTVVAELRDLEEIGINVGNDHLKCILVSILGDNLGSLGIGGFTENFSSSQYFCRYYEITKDDFMEDPHSIGAQRSCNTHANHVSMAKPGRYDLSKGVKFDSVFNCLGLIPCHFWTATMHSARHFRRNCTS